MLGLISKPNEVHIWRVDLIVEEAEISRCRQVLSRDELDRADRFHFERDSRRFIVAHAAMRDILGRYVHVPARDLSFSYGDKGKPELSKSLNDCIRFNLSHSGDLALLAITRGLNIGVDVEWINAAFAGQAKCERYFSPGETKNLRSLPPHQQAEAFFCCWTRKEAYIKARGTGLSFPLDSFDVAFGPGVPASLTRVKGDPGEVERWKMYSIDHPGYVGAVVVEGTGHFLQNMEWKPGMLNGDL